MNFSMCSRVCALLFCSICCMNNGSPLVAADHRDSPSARTNGSVDLNDLYVFQSPQRPENVVMILTVNPFAGVLSPTVFNTRAVYEFNVDTNADFVPNFVFRVYFSAARGGSQRFIVVQANGKPLVSGQTGKTTSIRTGGFVTAGLFDDPFFFDLDGFNNNFTFTTGNNAFAAANNSAIVLEVPRSMFGTNNISVYVRTLIGATQFDRTGRPAINPVLILGGARKDAFNIVTPLQEVAQFNTEVIARLIALGNTQAEAEGLAAVLIPDVMTVDTSSTAGFLNGRQLADDVIDAELNLLTKGAITTDLVNSNDKEFSDTFPYLAAPHVIAPPSP